MRFCFTTEFFEKIIFEIIIQRVNKPDESVSTAGRAHSNKETTPAKSVGMPIPVIVSDAHSKRKTAFIAGDSMTRVLSTARMCNPNIDVKIKSHSGGRVRDVENTLIRLSKTDHDYIENLDAIVKRIMVNREEYLKTINDEDV